MKWSVSATLQRVAVLNMFGLQTEPPRQARGPPRQTVGPPRKGAAVGVGIMRGVFLGDLRDSEI